MIELSKRAQSLKESATLALAAQAKKLKSEGHDILSLTVGEPDWPTVSAASEAGILAIKEGLTKYTPASGTQSLRQAIAEQFNKDYHQKVTANEVSVAAGAKYSLFAAFQVLLSSGDEALMPNPFWVSYPDMIELCDAKAIPVEFQGIAKDKKLQDQFVDSITSKTKMLLLNSPNNPSGLSLSSEDLKFIGDNVLKHPRIVVVSDDIYSYLTFKEPRAPHILDVCPALKERTICISGASKSYSMTGWRMGWAIGPEKVVKSMASFQSQSTGCPCSISQAAAEAAILNAEKEIALAKKLLIQRKELFENLLSQIPEVKFTPADGAFYIWLDVSAYLKKMSCDSSEFCKKLLEAEGLAVIPGQVFGQADFIRLSFAVDEKTIQKSVQRLQSFLGAL